MFESPLWTGLRELATSAGCADMVMVAGVEARHVEQHPVGFQYEITNVHSVEDVSKCTRHDDD